MAGFFGLFDYTKPGKGVPHPEEAPEQTGLQVLFDIFKRKFWSLIKINLMFFAFNLPAVILASYVMANGYGMFLGDDSFNAIIKNGASEQELLSIVTYIGYLLASIAVCIPMITVGPAQAGFTYIMRNYAREEHAFVWGDFKEHALKNFKQSLIVSVIDFFAVVLAIFSLIFYTNSGGFVGYTSAWFIGIALILFMMMHLYIYPMMVTFKLSIRQLYKNAFLFAIMKLPSNVGILLVCLVVILLPNILFIAVGINPMLTLFFLPLIMFSLISLITNYFVYPKLKRYMIDTLKEKENED